MEGFQSKAFAGAGQMGDLKPSAIWESGRDGGMVMIEMV